MIVTGLDTETTGILDPKHRIIEVCLQKWDSTSGLPIPGLHKTWRIHPERSIDPKAYAVHGISLDDLAGAPKMEAVIDEILGFLDGTDLVVAHNGDDFDMPFLRQEIERVRPLTTSPALLQFKALKWFDTMVEGRWATPWGGVPNLGALCYSCDVDYDPAKAHAADYDVAVMMKCFFFGIRTGFFKLP